MAAIRFQTARRATGSRPWVSSSRKTTSGSLSSARPTNRRWRWPPDRPPNGVRHRSRRPQLPRPRRREGDRRRTAAAPRPPACGRAAPSAGAGCRRVSRAAPVGGPGQPEHPDGAPVRPAEPLGALDGRRLAGPVGAEDPEDLATTDREVDAVDGDVGAVPLRQAPDLDRRVDWFDRLGRLRRFDRHKRCRHFGDRRHVATVRRHGRRVAHPWSIRRARPQGHRRSPGRAPLVRARSAPTAPRRSP